LLHALRQRGRVAFAAVAGGVDDAACDREDVGGRDLGISRAVSISQRENAMTIDTNEHDVAGAFALTVFMLVKTAPEWLGFSIDERFRLLGEHLQPIVSKHQAGVRLRFYDVEFYSARVTDLWMWEANDHHAYELLVEDLRETPFWDRYFDIVEILPGVENAYARNYGRRALAA